MKLALILTALAVVGCGEDSETPAGFDMSVAADLQTRAPDDLGPPDLALPVSIVSCGRTTPMPQGDAQALAEWQLAARWRGVVTPSLGLPYTMELDLRGDGTFEATRLLGGSGEALEGAGDSSPVQRGLWSLVVDANGAHVDIRFAEDILYPTEQISAPSIGTAHLQLSNTYPGGKPSFSYSLDCIP
jgi:hypothetical protein